MHCLTSSPSTFLRCAALCAAAALGACAQPPATTSGAARPGVPVAQAGTVGKINDAPLGRLEHCSSLSLVASGRPVTANTRFNCGPIGMPSIQELRDAGWDVKVTSRLPTPGWTTTVADAVDIAAVKRR